MSTFLNLLVYGLADGAILALAALGFVLIYKATSVINFAQGEFLLVGAYMFYTAFVVMGLPMIAAVLVGVLAAIVIGVVVERFILRPMIGEEPISIIMVTIGLSMLLKALVQMVLDETSPPMMVLPEALRKFAVGKTEVSRSQKETAFSLCHSGGIWGDYDNTWDFIENDGEGEQKGWRQRNFIKLMAYIKDLFKTESIVLDAIDWKAAGDATVVDVSPPSKLTYSTQN